jgi:hypothetical protein
MTGTYMDDSVSDYQTCDYIGRFVSFELAYSTRAAISSALSVIIIQDNTSRYTIISS